MKAAGKASSKPWADAFGNWRNLRLVLIALFGAMIGQAVVWYTAQFYVLFFLERVLKLEGAVTNLLVAAAIFISTPLYIFFGWLSDRVGRRPLVLAACLLAAVTYYPLFKALTFAVNPQLSHAVATAPVTVSADPKDCSFQFDPIGRARFSTSCDIVRAYLARAGVTYDTVDAPPGTLAEMRVGSPEPGLLPRRAVGLEGARRPARPSGRNRRRRLFPPRAIPPPRTRRRPIFRSRSSCSSRS